jgi:predicted phage terminase large subunit-like protein
MKKPLIAELVPQSRKSADYEKERNSYQAYCERVHRGRWKAAKFHSLICQKLEAVERGDITRLMLFMPPRHGKSQTVTETFPSWFLGRHPDARVIEVSYGIQFAEKFGLLNRRKIEEFGGRIFGIGVSADQSSKTKWDIAGHAGGMISVGLGGSITGEGADLMIIDDLIKNRQEAESEAMRRRVWEEWQDTLQTRLHPGAAVILIMTRWREDDIAGRILDEAEENGDEWQIVSFPCLAEEGGPDALGRPPGQPLWPEHGYDERWARRKRAAVGERTWNALYQQNPLPAEGNIIKNDWWKFYHTLPQHFDFVFQSWDMAFKGGEASDYVVGQVWGKLGVSLYLIDQTRERLSLPDTLKELLKLREKWPKTRAILIEDKANGPGIIDTLKDKVPGVIPIAADISKEARCWAASAAIEAGNVYLPDKDRPWVDALLAEFARFPAGKNDDQVDAATQAINWAQSRLYGGLVYGVWSGLNVFTDDDVPAGQWSLCERFVSVNCGLNAPMVFIDVWDDGDVSWIRKEYYYDARSDANGRRQKTNSEFAKDLADFIGEGYPGIIVDPLAESFILEIRSRGLGRVIDADENVLDGIRKVSELLRRGKIRVHKDCARTIAEFESYAWDGRALARGEESPQRENDRCLEPVRCFVNEFIRKWRLVE